MKKNSPLSILCTVIFLIGIITAFFGSFNQGNHLLKYILLLISIIYLLSGWYIFKGYHPEGHPLLLFLIGYLYSGVFLAFTFIAAAWPLARAFIAIAPFWAAVQIIMVSVIWKKIPRESFIQFLIEGGLMIILSTAVLLRFLLAAYHVK